MHLDTMESNGATNCSYGILSPATDFSNQFWGFFRSEHVCNQFFIVPVNDLIIEYTIRLKDPSEQNDIISLPTLPVPSE
jgi:hypothetical protein